MEPLLNESCTFVSRSDLLVSAYLFTPTLNVFTVSVLYWDDTQICAPGFNVCGVNGDSENKIGVRGVIWKGEEIARRSNWTSQPSSAFQTIIEIFVACLEKKHSGATWKLSYESRNPPIFMARRHQNGPFCRESREGQQQ